MGFHEKIYGFRVTNTEKDNYWVQNPFKIKEKPKGFHSIDYENLIHLSSDTQLEAKFRQFH